MTDNVLYGIGNPLLDILATVNVELIKKYNLKENDTILAEEKHMPLYEELVKNYEVQYIPGGATQNAIKVAQWILKRKNACAFSGSIKNDNYGKILKESCEKIGVKTLYQYCDGPEPTGVCAGLITGHNRSLVTSLGSSGKFTADFLGQPEVWKLAEQARFFYSSSFFLMTAQPALIKLAKHSLEHNKTFCLNLGADFLMEFFNKPVIEAIEYSDFVFGNESEALKLSSVCKFGTTVIAEIAERIANMPFHKIGGKRTVVISQGADPIIVFSAADGRAKEFPVRQLDPELIIDTTGAGDSFVGGFLAQLVQGRSIEECVRCGKWVAEIVIQRAGCTFPEVCSFN